MRSWSTKREKNKFVSSIHVNYYGRRGNSRKPRTIDLEGTMFWLVAPEEGQQKGLVLVEEFLEQTTPLTIALTIYVNAQISTIYHTTILFASQGRVILNQ